MAQLQKREQVENLAENLKQFWEIKCSVCGTTEMVQFNAITGYFAAQQFYDRAWRFHLKGNQVLCPGCRDARKVQLRGGED